MLCRCKICGNEFGTYTALASHTKWKHGPQRKHECPICHIPFRDSFGVRRHVQGVHSSSRIERTTTCPLCDYSASKKSMSTHFQDVHSVNIVEETLAFNGMNDFNSWKGSVESETFTRYVKHRASKKMKDGTTTSYFYCYRDGQFKSHRRGLRPKRRIESIKLNAYCPASLKVQECNGQVTVLFRKTHVGHTSDFVEKNTVMVIEEQESVVLDTDEAIINNCKFDDLQVVHNGEVPNTDEGIINNCKFDDLQVVHNDEVSTTVNEHNREIESFPNSTENVAIVIEIPNSSEDTLLIEKQKELEKLIDIINSIKTNDGLEAFKQHVAPLQSIVAEAENKWCNLISVHVVDENNAQAELINNSCREGEVIQTLNIFDSESLTKAVSSDVQFSTEVVIPQIRLG